MFSSRGLFKDIQCPKLGDCDLPACIFAHDKVKQEVDSKVDEYDPFATAYGQSTGSVARNISPPPSKRLKTSHVPETVSAQPLLDAARGSSLGPEALNGTPLRSVTPSARTDTILCGPLKVSSPITASESPAVIRPVSPPPQKRPTVSRPVSPPLVRPKPSQPAATATATRNPLKKEPLYPRNIPSQPVQFAKRHEILKKFHAQVQIKDKMSAGGDKQLQAAMLTETELIKFVLDREEEAARKFEGTPYVSHLGYQMMNIKKLSAKEWRTYVKETIRKVEEPKVIEKGPAKRPETGMQFFEHEIAVLRGLKTSLVGLEKHGYVTSPLSEQDIALAKAAAESAAGWEVCDRCNTRFQVFAGRNEDGKLTSGGECRYHWAKPWQKQQSRIDRAVGGSGATYPCCGQSPGTEGCTEAESHIFNVKDVKRLAGILQFEATPPNPTAQKKPVSFDCEMGYTTLGLEVIRVTAVSWPDGKELLDVLVRPYGEVLDLNTRFSGVTPKDFASAIAYGEEADGEDTSEDGELEPEPLRKVESPAAARQLLFGLLAPDKPLIGHAIDNDLNTLRIIHPLVIDTVLLYPHPKGLPIRYSLKVLTSQYLSRSIQSSGAAGHDSKEDAIATGDLVTLKVANKWKQMAQAGWRWEDGKLVAPEIKAAL